MASPDFGWREGFTQLGHYRTARGGFAFVYAETGGGDPRVPGSAPAPAASLWAWIVSPAYKTVTMSQDYEPSIVNAFAARAFVRAGETRSFPSIEADALVAAGIAAYA